jgi:hypothetical protein
MEQQSLVGAFEALFFGGFSRLGESPIAPLETGYENCGQAELTPEHQRQLRTKQGNCQYCAQMRISLAQVGHSAIL